MLCFLFVRSIFPDIRYEFSDLWDELKLTKQPNLYKPIINEIEKLKQDNLYEVVYGLEALLR